ncbi:MAG TPA: hypothetical protein VG838_09535 [Opitutaceae bacterium]|nr:hypothetical protein [Opitutaceae bacterium]
MTAKSNSLTKSDIREIISHLEDSLTVLNRRSGHMSAGELSLKSMLGALKRELEAQLRNRSEHEE